MKLVLIIGRGAVGKMTVGQELMKITDLRLFHNHVMIEPVIEVFGSRQSGVVNELRDVVFKNFAASGAYGLIFTFMWAFDQKEDWDYIEHVKDIFRPYGTEFYCAELVASEEVRLYRNATGNRLQNKASKRDVEASKARMLREDERYRLESMEGEVPFENYIRIDNSDMRPEEAARMIKEKFAL